jgi:hypothetical protein
MRTQTQILKSTVIKKQTSPYRLLRMAAREHIKTWGNESARRIVKSYLPDSEDRLSVEHIPAGLRLQAVARLNSGPYSPSVDGLTVNDTPTYTPLPSPL